MKGKPVGLFDNRTKAEPVYFDQPNYLFILYKEAGHYQMPGSFK